MVARLKAVFNGQLFDGVERFSFGLTFRPGLLEAPEPEDMGVWATQIVGVLNSHESDGWCAEMSANAGFTDVSTLYYDETSTTAIYSGTAPVSGVSGVGAPSKTAQTARVVSLLTPFSGRRYRGRVYLPALASTITTAGRSTVADTWAPAFADFLLDVAAAFPGAGSAVPVVYSAAANAVTDVTRVRVGDILDTQRRRRDTMVENFKSAPV